MKKLHIILITLALAAVTLADTIYIPDNVAEVKSATVSSGGGSSAVMYFKVFCTLDDGTDVLFTGKKISAGSLFGIARWTMPTEFVIKKKPGLRGKLVWK